MTERLSHRPISIRAAQQFVDAHHRHNKAPRGARFALTALFNGAVVGVCIVGRPVARMLQNDTVCEVLRCCVADNAPSNTCSYLYGAARRVWQSWGGDRIITYTLESESGGSLRGAGFTPVAKTKKANGGWARKGRERLNAPIYQVPKTRWQIDL